MYQKAHCAWLRARKVSVLKGSQVPQSWSHDHQQ